MPDLMAVFTLLNQDPQSSLHPLNDSFIVLIPKKEPSCTPSDYRPISLLNGIQKVYSKILADKLKPLLHNLLAPNQTGFLKQRSILHGFHYAQQVLQAAAAQKRQVAALKADIFKAFDTLHWQFLVDSLRARNFPQPWISRIQNNVLKGQSRIMLNSVAGKPVILKRGVRQGDPLSPYLFNISIDFLARWLHKLNELQFIVSPFPQCMTCLLYADDTMLFLKPTSSQLLKAKLIFQIFGQISGLTINLQKSELSITASSVSSIQSLAAIIGCKPKNFPITYLGLPLSEKRLTKPDFLPLIDRFQTALSGWRASLLSIGGRLVLTNSVLSALPHYFMSLFMLPKWVLRKIDKIRRQFLWHGHKAQQAQQKGLSIKSKTT